MTVKELNTEEKIANLQNKIFTFKEQLGKKVNSSANQSTEKHIKLLESKLNQLIFFNNLSVGDWVCNGQPDVVGKIVELKQKQEYCEAWVLWEDETVPKPSSPSTLAIQDPIKFAWQWNQDKNAIIRTFDGKECDDYQAMLENIKALRRSLKNIGDQADKDRISKQLLWIHDRWSTVTKDRFRIGDLVKYNQKHATVIKYQIQGELLFCWLKFDDNEELLVSPRELERTGIFQQALNFEPETYPCVKEIAIASITRERSLQQRVQLDPATVQEYAELLRQGEKLEPVQIVLDNRGNYWLWDGFHTLEANIKNQETFIEARITLGTYEDAFKLSLGANAKRGLKLSREDKHNKVKNALFAKLTDETGTPLSNRAIAEICCVSHSMVNDVKKELFPPEIEPNKKETLNLKASKETQSNSEPIAEKESQSLTENSQTSQLNESQVPSGRSSTELEQSTVISRVSSNDDDQPFVVYVKEDIVYIKKTSLDKRLVGYLGSAAMVLENHAHSVDLLFWGEHIIENVAKEDVGLMEQKVNLLARIPTWQLAILIQKFKSPEEAIALSNCL